MKKYKLKYTTVKTGKVWFSSTIWEDKAIAEINCASVNANSDGLQFCEVVKVGSKMSRSKLGNDQLKEGVKNLLVSQFKSILKRKLYQVIK